MNKASGDDGIPVDLSGQFSSVALSCLTLCHPLDSSMPGFPVHHQLPEFTQIHVHWVSDAFQPSHLLSSPSPPSLNLSQHQCPFQWVSSLHQVTKVLELQLQHQSFQWIFKVFQNIQWTSFRMDWFDLLAAQGILKSVLQHHSSKTSILWHAAFFIVKLSHPHVTTGKTIALTFVGKVMSLLINILSRFVFLGYVFRSFSSKEQVSFNFMASVTVHRDFEGQENKICHCFHCFPI